MAETLQFNPNGSREERYADLAKQWTALVQGEPNRVANLANISAVLFEAFNWHWVGFYLVDVERDELVLGPFQGPLACTRLHHGKGVCAAAWDTGAPQIVPDVHAFPGHVACSTLTQSELVLPIRSGNHIVGVLDIDSAQPADFDEKDLHGLASLMDCLSTNWSTWE